MHRKIITALFLSWSCVSQAGNYMLYIVFQSSDCINCSAPLGQLGSLDPHISVVILIEAKNKTFFKEYLDSFDGLNPSNITVSCSDTLFKKFNTLNVSSCHFCAGDRQVLSFPLNKYFEYRGAIHALATDYGSGKMDSLSIDSIPLSERITVQREDGHIFMYDYLLNKAVVTSVPALLGQKPEFQVLKPNISKVQLMTMAGLDTSVYKNLLPLFKSLHKDKPHFEALFYERDTLRALTVFNYPKFRGKDTIISNYYYVLNYCKGKPFTAYYIAKDSVEAASGYYLDNTMPFYTQAGRYYFSTYKENCSRENTILSSWGKHRKTLVFLKSEPYKVPAYYCSSQEKYEGMTALLKDRLYFYSTYPFIIDLEDSAVYDLGADLERYSRQKYFSSGKFRDRVFINDVYLRDGILYVLYFVDKAAHVMLYDISAKRILAVKDVPVTGNYFYPSFSFVNEKTLLVTNKERSRIYLIR